MFNTQSIPQIPPVEEAYKFLNVELNPDGSLTRHGDPPTLPASPEPDPNNPNSSSLSKDIPLNAATNTFIRLFRPLRPPPDAKLPLLIYFHGGGFVFASAAIAPFHASCCRMSTHLPALIASVEYRLAPEHRLPAAYQDAMDAVSWARDQAAADSGGGADPWMEELADFSRVFLMGSSAGGNIVYRTGLALLDEDVRPMKIVGLIMNQPFFGGAPRTGSELKYYNDPIIPLHGADLLWSLALPPGADRAHEYCDPLAGGGPHEERIRRLPVSLVRGYSGDLLVDKQKEFAEMLTARGARVVAQFEDGGHHAVELFDPKFADALYDAVRDFVVAY
ncbi:putative carboxylesterase 8 [Salvia divinorum]|uniref:Carboxylesterase 8 n=1 Tax=Salvia divinorum TaxID=28513 RepID=A0ABD1GH62_SALDI